MYIELWCKLFFLPWNVAEKNLKIINFEKHSFQYDIFFPLKSSSPIHSTPPDLLLPLPDKAQDSKLKFEFQILKNEFFSISLSWTIFGNIYTEDIHFF